jgi:threonine aldolase
MGGGWRQCGILAAGALFAIDNNFARLKEDHENAAYLFEELTRLGFDVVKPHTNILTITSTPTLMTFEGMTPILKTKGILVSGAGTKGRITTHLQVPRVACEQLIQNLELLLLSIKN